MLFAFESGRYFCLYFVLFAWRIEACSLSMLDIYYSFASSERTSSIHHVLAGLRRFLLWRSFMKLFPDNLLEADVFAELGNLFHELVQCLNALFIDLPQHPLFKHDNLRVIGLFARVNMARVHLMLLVLVVIFVLVTEGHLDLVHLVLLPDENERDVGRLLRLIQ